MEERRLIGWVVVCLSLAFGLALPAFAESRDLYVVFGGFNSCKSATKGGPLAPEHMTMARPFRQTVEAHTKNYDVLLTCLDSSGTELTFQEGWGGTPKSLGKSAFYQAGNLSKLGGYIDRAASRAKGLVHFVGHSLGGWLAIQTANHLSHSHTLGNLVSIDPISPFTCDRTQFLFRTGMQVAGTVSDLLKRTPSSSPSVGGEGCVQAPRDITPTIQREILDRMAKDGGRWLNFYQTSFPYLHSGPLSEVPDNFEVTDFRTQVPLTTWQSINAHSRIFAADSVWTRLGPQRSLTSALEIAHTDYDTH